MDLTTIGVDELIISAVVITILVVITRATVRGIINARKKGLDAGIVFGDIIMSQEGLIMKIIVFVFLSVEAGLTAYYHNAAGMSDVYAQSYQIPVIIKFGIHYLFALGSFVLTYTTPKKWIHFLYVAPTERLIRDAKKRKAALAKRRKENITGTDVLLSFFNASFNTLVGFILPLANVYLLAIASRQTVQAKLLIFNIWHNIFGGWLGGISSDEIARLPFSVLAKETTEAIPYMVEGIDYPVLGPEYNVFSNLLYPMQVIFVTSVLHYMITFGQSVNTFARDKNAGNTGDTSKLTKKRNEDKEDKGKAEDIEIDLENNPEDPLEEMLAYYGYKGSDLDDKVDQAVDALVDMSSKHLTNLNVKISSIIFAIRKAEDGKIRRESDTSRSIRRDVHALFDGKAKRGQGFGISLSTSVGGIQRTK